jgi:hypothetical protein
MQPGMLALAAILLLGSSLAQAADDPLARARQLYNDRRFEAAALAAEEGRTPDRADVVDLIIARAFLERFRESQSPTDLATARGRLRRISPARLNEDERSEYLVGLGVALFLEGANGAAASIFDTLFESPTRLSVSARDRVLDWWATAMDREARPRSDIDRQPLYLRIRDRMRSELAQNPGSAVASYWLSAAASGQGDHQSAWDTAMAGWVRAQLTEDQGATLRSELDVLVQRMVVPQRARALAQPPEQIEQEWEDFKSRWQKPESRTPTP